MSMLIKVNQRFKRYMAYLIYRDFGHVSIPKGLFHIITLYDKYVPQWERNKVKKSKIKRLRWKA